MHREHKLVYTSVMPIRWGDMDAMGHVNNTIYFRYMEVARLEWFSSFGYDVTNQRDTPILLNTSCTFLSPLTYPGDIRVRTYLGEIGRSSFQTYHDIVRTDEDKVYAEGTGKIVWMNPETGKSMPLPDAVRTLLEKYHG